MIWIVRVKSRLNHSQRELHNYSEIKASEPVTLARRALRHLEEPINAGDRVRLLRRWELHAFTSLPERGYLNIGSEDKHTVQRK